MSLPFKPVTAICTAVVSYLLVNCELQHLISSKTFIGTFLQLWLLLFTAWAFYKVILYPKYFSPLRHLPGPTGGSLFMGQFERIKNEPSGAPMADWVNSVPNNGIIRYLGLFNKERLLVTTAKSLTEVLTTKNYDFKKPIQISRGLSRILGTGLLLAEGEVHKVQRKNLMPAFSHFHIKDLYPIFWSKAKESVLALSAQIQTHAGKPKQSDLAKGPIADDQAVLEVGEWASRVTLDIIGVAGLGQDFHAMADPDSELFRTYSAVFKADRQAQFLGLLNLLIPIWIVRILPSKRNDELTAALHFVRKFLRQVIKDKKEKLEKNELTDVDILSVALESGAFTEDNLVDQLMTTMAAGHETTASAMTWAIYLLCAHPTVQTRLRAEIRANLPSIQDDKQVTSLDIAQMPYINAVCSEVLRHHPPIPMTVRIPEHDTTIVGEHVPAGTLIVIVPLATNKDKALWGEDAAKFNPERWMPDGSSNSRAVNGGAESNYANLTFLHGPRGCIGQTFARSEFACLLAAWVGRFEFELRDVKEMDEKNVLIKPGVTSKPANGMWVKARVVEGW